MLRTRHRAAARLDERGSSVAEVVLAASLLLMGAVASGRVTAAAVAAQGRAAARDRAVAATYDVADLLRVERCLFATGAEVPVVAGAVEQRCRDTLGLEGALGVGRGAFDDGARSFAFTYGSRWVHSGTTTSAGCTDAAYAARPAGVQRWIDVHHREGRDARVRRIEGFEALPADGYQQRSAQRSNLVVVTTDAAAVVELAGVAGPSVARAADDAGCAWFPSLRSGTYTVRRVDAAGAGRHATVSFVADPRAAAPHRVDL